MLTYFSVKGYKGFKDKIELDLTNKGRYAFNDGQIKNGIINKGIIYGKNGSGKSNLGTAIFDIVASLSLYKYKGKTETNFTNIPQRVLEKGIYKNLETNGNVEFEYRFVFGNDKVTYKYKKIDLNIVISEELFFNGEKVFDFQSAEKRVNTTIEEFKNISFNAVAPGPSLLFFGCNFIVFDEGSLMNKFITFISRMLWFRCLSEGNEAYGGLVRHDSIDEDIIQNDKVGDFQNFLSSFDVDYQLEKGKIQIIGSREMNVIVAKYGKNKVPLNRILSTGTQALELFFYWSLQFEKFSFIYIDEFDAFYHYETSSKIVEFLNSKTSFQSFVTTHNTSLMTNRLMRPDTLFLISNNKIKPLCDCTDGELREGHSLEKIYRANGFEG